MNDPQKLIDIARQIDPDLKDPEQALIDALVVVKALAILEDQEAKPISVTSKVVKVPRYAKSLNDAEETQDKKKTMGRTIKKYLSKSGVRTSAFARELNVSVSTIHGWIQGKWYPTIRYRDKLEQILNGEIQIKSNTYAHQAQIEEGN